MAGRQDVRPVILRDGKVTPAERIRFFDHAYDENWLQELIYRHPELLPASEFDPVFKDLIPVTRELPTDAGPVDLVCVSPDGFVSLIETKLWRNPDARRKVVAQIIDYAKEMAGWSYEELEDAIRRSGFVPKSTSLLGIARDYGEVADESAFVDNVSRSLEFGRFLLLIVGDGIREGVEQLVGYLQQTPHLGFTLGLVELAIYRLGGEPGEVLFVQPRVIARTREVTRAIVKISVPINRSDVSVTIPPPPDTKDRKPISEERFLEELSECSGSEVIDFAEWVLDNAEKHGLAIVWGESGPMLRYVDEESRTFFTLGQLSRHGDLRSVERFLERIQKIGLSDDIWRGYFDELVRLVPGAVRKKFTSASGANEYETVVFGSNPGANDFVPLENLAPRREEWFVAMARVIEEIKEALEAG